MAGPRSQGVDNGRFADRISDRDGESLATLDVELVKLEQNPAPQILSNIFRLVHTIKGTCGFLGLPRLEAVAHAGENVLGKFRDGELQVTPAAVTLILASIDRIKMILNHIEQTETEPEGDDKDLIAALNAHAEGRDAAPPPAAAAPPPPPPAPPPPRLLPRARRRRAGAGSGSGSGARSGRGRRARARRTCSPGLPAQVAQQQVAAAGAAAANQESALAAQTIRVNVELLENLMTLVSELVLTRNQLAADGARQG